MKTIHIPISRLPEPRCMLSSCGEYDPGWKRGLPLLLRGERFFMAWKQLYLDKCSGTC